jgi:hypothetical protein
MVIRTIGCLLVFALGILAQSGIITGKVVDLSGDPVAKAVIQATNQETKAVYKATTSAAGVYTLAQLPAGTYQLSNTTLGFMPFVQRNVKVAAAETLQLNLHFQDIQLNTLGDGREFLFSPTLPILPLRDPRPVCRTESRIFPACGTNREQSILESPK